MLKIENLSYRVEENNSIKSILENINLTIPDGTNLVITGPNGSGKSTLAKIIMGILQPTTGKIYYNDKDITNMNITDRAKLGIAYAFQQPVRFKGITTKSLLAKALNENANINNTCDSLSSVGLCARDYLDRELNQSLSGGELKRIEIATALARNCPLTIYDEPEAGIDIWSFGGLIDIFKKCGGKDKINIIISHQEKIFEVANKMLLLRAGRIAEYGTPKQVLPLLNPNAVCKKLSKEDF